VGERRVGRALQRDGLGIGGEEPRRVGGAADHGKHSVNRRAGADLGPCEGLDQRLWQRQIRCLDQDVLRRRRTIEKPRQSGEEVLGNGAAQAAIGELDNVILGTGSVIVGEQQLAIDAELAELVDDNGETAPVGAP